MVRLSRAMLRNVAKPSPPMAWLAVRHADKNARPISRLFCPSLNKPVQFHPVQSRAVGEIMMHALFDGGLRVFAGGQFRQVNHQRHRLVQRKFADPAQNEFLRVTVQIFFGERRGVHRVEQLADLAQVQLDFVRRAFRFVGHASINHGTGPDAKPRSLIFIFTSG